MGCWTCGSGGRRLCGASLPVTCLTSALLHRLKLTTRQGFCVGGALYAVAAGQASRDWAVRRSWRSLVPSAAAAAPSLVPATPPPSHAEWGPVFP